VTVRTAAGPTGTFEWAEVGSVVEPTEIQIEPIE
jgi:hypothetical protein